MGRRGGQAGVTNPATSGALPDPLSWHSQHPGCQIRRDVAEWIYGARDPVRRVEYSLGWWGSRVRTGLRTHRAIARDPTRWGVKI